jgi:hypothetical protein
MSELPPLSCIKLHSCRISGKIDLTIMIKSGVTIYFGSLLRITITIISTSHRLILLIIRFGHHLCGIIHFWLELFSRIIFLDLPIRGLFIVSLFIFIVTIWWHIIVKILKEFTCYSLRHSTPHTVNLLVDDIHVTYIIIIFLIILTHITVLIEGKLIRVSLLLVRVSLLVRVVCRGI